MQSRRHSAQVKVLWTKIGKTLELHSQERGGDVHIDVLCKPGSILLLLYLQVNSSQKVAKK